MTLPVTVDLDDTRLAPEVAEQFRISFGLEETPATLTEWVEAASELLQSGFQKSFDPRSDPNSFHHEVHVGEESFYCKGLFEALILPFIHEAGTGFLIRSQSPSTETIIKVSVTRDSFSINPDTAVTSFGVARDVVAPEYFDVPPDIAYHRFNQYTNTFPDEQTYQFWADQTENAVTMSLSIAEALVLARSMTESWDELHGVRVSNGE